MSSPLNDTLGQEHRTLQREALRQRGAFERSAEGKFAKGMRVAMAEFDRMRSEGVSFDDGVKGIEAVLREEWPNPVSKFANCPDCGGTGWEGKTCWSEHRCGRENCVRQHPAFEHAYVVPCICVDGERHRTRVQVVEDQIAAAGRMQKRKPRGFSRVGS